MFSGARVSLLAGRFVLVREIGSGGMSTVFLGRDEVLDRPVAVKILRSDLEGSDVSARFQREGRTAASSPEHSAGLRRRRWSTTAATSPTSSWSTCRVATSKRS